ncbi:hypothetical protein CHS0354_041299 [Potamilus streckersoni]|uniref:RING-type domain-containing protein n=1 Tax=Potamilus streckersoni TaxID=2493646 RepID=A0AAE0SE88_9BIVA|nr:hypothetical protein CHS0354_041299 [Potamilus streckersoni]
MQIPVSVTLPLLGIGLFTLILSFILCCYMWRLKRAARLEKGYKQVKYFQQLKQKFPNETCPVCLVDFELKEYVSVCPCQHIFHQNCLIEWLQHKNACPLCKAPVQFFADQRASLAGETTGLIPNVPMRVPPNV